MYTPSFETPSRALGGPDDPARLPGAGYRFKIRGGGGEIKGAHYQGESIFSQPGQARAVFQAFSLVNPRISRLLSQKTKVMGRPLIFGDSQ
jgi:hypothetical protein